MFAFDAEWQGNPEPPTFSCCLYFSSPLSCSVLAHLASVNSSLTLWDCLMEALRYLIHHGLRNVKRAHYARPHLTAAASRSTYPMNLFGISSINVWTQWLRQRKDVDDTRPPFRDTVLLVFMLAVSLMATWQPPVQRETLLLKLIFFFFIKTSVKLQPKLW